MADLQDSKTPAGQPVKAGRDAYVAGGDIHVHVERLPPVLAGRTEIAVYLRVLIDWLNTDSWARDRRFAGPALIPANIERKLQMSTASADPKDSLNVADADSLAGKCHRLVILGAPGSGKTWLARRAARRAAEAALAALAVGTDLDRVELPLYTTCSRLANATGDIRTAVVSSALDWLGDLGGSRISVLVSALFAERNAPTLLVIDSLDEAGDVDERLRQADTLSWRVILTSRPSSWNGQLAVGGKDNSRQVGELQPWQYPQDVEPFIAAWFSGQPAQAAALITQLRERSALQHAAAVPLVAAFYCIIGADQPLPDRRSDLHAKVIARMLTGRWRGANSAPDTDYCFNTLRDWAWSAASSDPTTGIGVLQDEFPAPRAYRQQADQDALDHLAVPVPPEPRDLDSGAMRRRFVHRVLHEHLVAEYVARMPAVEAAGELLNHLWYDRDWEQAAPAALALHPNRSQVLAMLMHGMASKGRTGDVLSEANGCWELHRFLARVAQESSEADWEPEATAIIGQARLELTSAPDLRDLREVIAKEWPTSNRSIIKSLLQQLPDACLRGFGDELAEVVAALYPMPEELSHGREVLLALLPEAVAQPWKALRLVRVVAKLNPTLEQLAQSRQALLDALSVGLDHFETCGAAEAVAELNPTTDDLAHVRNMVLSRLEAEDDISAASDLATTLARLEPAPVDLACARAAILALMHNKLKFPGWLRHFPDDAASRIELMHYLADVFAELRPTISDLKRVRNSLIMGIAGAAHHPEIASYLSRILMRFNPTGQDKAAARKPLLAELSRTEGHRGEARYLAATVAMLEPSTLELDRARAVTLIMLADRDHRVFAVDSIMALTELAPTPEELKRARDIVCSFLAEYRYPHEIPNWTKTLFLLEPTPEELERAKRAIMANLAQSGRHGNGMERAADAFTSLGPTAEELTHARQTLLALLVSEASGVVGLGSSARCLEWAEAVSKLTPAPVDLFQIRNILFELLSGDKENRKLPLQVAELMPRMDPAPDDLARLRTTLLDRNYRQFDELRMAEALGTLSPNDSDLAQARRSALARLYGDYSPDKRLLLDVVSKLNPTAADLADVNNWPLPPTPALLSAVRRNSTLDAWLAHLPILNGGSPQLPYK